MKYSRIARKGGPRGGAEGIRYLGSGLVFRSGCDSTVNEDTRDHVQKSNQASEGSRVGLEDRSTKWRRTTSHPTKGAAKADVKKEHAEVPERWLGTPHFS